jgi:hypothetical protein
MSPASACTCVPAGVVAALVGVAVGVGVGVRVAAGAEVPPLQAAVALTSTSATAAFRALDTRKVKHGRDLP